MPRDLPPTASLRAFVRAARTQSMKRAAAELHVSASALSRQIQALERHLGIRLFQRLNPGLALDAAIRFGRGPWKDLHGEPILDLDFFPVCSPRLATGDAPLRRPADLARHTLIHVAQTPDAWAAWLRGAGVAELVPRRHVTYDHVALALSAAESGQGVALSAPILCGARLRTKRLRRPFRTAVRSAETYHFVCRPESLEAPRVTLFRDWLVERLARADAQPASADAN